MKISQQILARSKGLLVLAGVFHVLITAAILLAGKHQLLPRMFDEQGIAFTTVPDGTNFIKDALFLGDSIRHGDFSGWLHQSYSFHVKIYAVSFAIFTPLFGENILNAEPLNLLYYLALIVIVYKLTAQVFNSTAGLLAAAIVSIWPSLLLHSTQMSKDTLFICEMLLLCLVLVRLLMLTYVDRRWLLDVGLGGLAGLLLWKTRPDFAVILLATIALAGLLLTVRYIREKRILVSNAIGITTIFAITLSGMFVLNVYRLSDHPRLGYRHPAHRSDLRWWQVAQRVGAIRDGFITEYRLAGSNVGENVRITNVGDLVGYLPWAAAIGLSAPFPVMWFESGVQAGPLARKVSGAETVALYLIEVLALFALWRGRRNLAPWFLMSVALSGIVSLGLVVVNVGALFRQRYVFVILLLVLAAGQLGSWFDSREEQRTRLSDGDNLSHV